MDAFTGILKAKTSLIHQTLLNERKKYLTNKLKTLNKFFLSRWWWFKLVTTSKSFINIFKLLVTPSSPPYSYISSWCRCRNPLCRNEHQQPCTPLDAQKIKKRLSAEKVASRPSGHKQITQTKSAPTASRQGLSVIGSCVTIETNKGGWAVINQVNGWGDAGSRQSSCRDL